MNPYAAELEEAHERERVLSARIRTLESEKAALVESLKVIEGYRRSNFDRMEKAEADLAAEEQHHDEAHGDNCVLKRAAGRESENRRSSTDGPDSEPLAGSTPAAKPATRSDEGVCLECGHRGCRHSPFVARLSEPAARLIRNADGTRTGTGTADPDDERECAG